MPGDRDTIAAIATPAGAGGVGIVRLSGPGAVALAARLIGREPAALKDRRLMAAHVLDPASGERLDGVLCVAMRAPRSFTGEDVAEIHGHGGAVNMARLLRAALAAGARHAEPGEFTRRAFENGRIDLTRAEAVLGVIEASSERALRLAQGQLAGTLGERIAELRRAGTELLADLEASIDFPEEGIDPAGRAEIGARATRLARECSDLAATFEAGRALRDGIEVALCGPVNAGKSSLFNRLVGRERALVAPEPGTTRDFLEASVVWRGVAVTLIDTAGEREADTEVERRGIDLGARRAREADVEVHLVAADDHRSVDGSRADREPSPGARRIVRVVSKGDRAVDSPTGLVASAATGLVTSAATGQVTSAVSGLVTSAVTGQGIEEMIEAVLAAAVSGGLDQEGGALLTSERQRAGVARAAAAFDRTGTGAAAGLPDELLALEAREAVDALAEVLGQEVGDEVLDALFARFCIGK